MSSADPPICFDSCRAAIAELLKLDARTDIVEHTIDAYPLDRDAKDALWLWAIGRRTGSPRPGVRIPSPLGTLRPRHIAGDDGPIAVRTDD